ncbi:TetR/AcrR family transcriptional regulator [Leucobacter albus]|uniref:TetR/AcrR family transcriptional regulator n=1 Tax=Leucobacter albus TaxID=272210 RepID=A0ABW3TR85_9MICO
MSKASRTKVQLFEVAIDMFSRLGYDAVTVKDIAEEVGVTERTFFRHFPHKSTILFPASAEVLSAARQQVLDIDAGSPAEAAVAMTIVMARQLEQFTDWHPERYRILHSSRELLAVEALQHELWATEICNALVERFGIAELDGRLLGALATLVLRESNDDGFRSGRQRATLVEAVRASWQRLVSLGVLSEHLLSSE